MKLQSAAADNLVSNLSRKRSGNTSQFFNSARSAA
jgi:hypothetical protein